MTIAIEEKNRSTTGGTTQWRVGYILRAEGGDAGSITALEAAQLIADNVPSVLLDTAGGSLILGDVQIDDFIETPALTLVLASALYNPPEEGTRLGGDETTPESEAVYEFSYQAQSEHIYYALSTTAYGTNAPDFGNKIRVRYDGQDMVHDGIDLPGANTTNVWRLTVPKGFVTSTYEALVEGMMGKTNSVPFKGRPAGTLRFVQCQSSVSSGGTLGIAWGCQYSPNRTGLTIAGISGVAIGGHQIWWTLDEKTLDLTANKMVLEPRAVYVHTVHESDDFNQLGF